MRGVAYIRVSTREQDEEVQRKAIEEFTKTRDIEIVKWYVDKGESGAKPFKQRPSAQRLLQDLEEIKPDCIVSWALDRLGRTMLDTVQTVLEFENRGIKVITIKEEWLQTLDSNIRKLILSILAWVAEFERQRIRERQEEAWRQGKQKGRPPKITDKELEMYIKRYPGISIRAITAIINSDRERRGLPRISYYTVLAKLKKMGYKKELVKNKEIEREIE